VSAGGASVTTGTGGRFPPHAASRSAAPRRAWEWAGLGGM
jgi:hypothetical protein